MYFFFLDVLKSSIKPKPMKHSMNEGTKSTPAELVAAKKKLLGTMLIRMINHYFEWVPVSLLSSTVDTNLCHES